MIPKVRDWQVKFKRTDGSIVAQTIIPTINKRFALWQANEEQGYPLMFKGAVKVTVSLVR